MVPMMRRLAKRSTLPRTRRSPGAVPLHEVECWHCADSLVKNQGVAADMINSLHEVAADLQTSVGELAALPSGEDRGLRPAEAAGIIGWLEVLESDVAHNLAEMRTWVSSGSSASRFWRLQVDGAPHREAEVDGLKKALLLLSELEVLVQHESSFLLPRESV